MVSSMNSASHQEYIGLSTDDKTQLLAANGDIFFEMDTTKVLVYDANNKIWRELE